jgi:hypothetical protein
MLRRATWLLLSLTWAMACGGRYQSSGDDDEPGGGSTGQGGTGATSAGTPSRGGSSSGGKVSGGGKGGTISVGTGGATTMGGNAIGGFGTAGACACDPVVCAPGYMTVPDPGGCCFHCELDVKRCDQAHADYRRLRQDMLEKYRSSGCTSDSDCTVYYEKNACDVNGCPLIVPLNTIMSFASNLDSYAQMSCTGCPTEPLHPCAPLPPMLCRMGRCQ